MTLRARFAIRRSTFRLEIELEAPPGVTVLFGPSGSGKSTALAAIAGLVRPETGTITLGDEIWFDGARTDVPAERRGIGFVFQSLALFPHMNAVKNVMYGGASELRARQLLERFQVAHLAERRPRTFSGGEAQRVALARALAREPRVILLDEPFSALDRELRMSLAADLRAAVAELQIPVLHVTHHRQEARAVGDRLVRMAAGRVTGSGSVDAMLDDDRPAVD